MKRTLLLLTIFVFFLPISCAKKPSAEECQRAVAHMFELLQQQSVQQMKEHLAKTGGPPLRDDVAQRMSESFKQMQNDPQWQRIHSAHLEACGKQPQTRAACVIAATTVEELVNTCGMKPSASPRGGMQVSWP